MRTGRSLTVFQSLLLLGEDVPAWSGGCTWSRGVYLPGLGGGGVPACSQGAPGQVLPPRTEFLTHASEIITLAKTSFRPVIIKCDDKVWNPNPNPNLSSYPLVEMSHNDSRVFILYASI